MNLLAANSLLDNDAYIADLLVLNRRAVPDTLFETAKQRQESQSQLIQFFFVSLAPVPLDGADGLKDRSRLMEFRYGNS